MAIHHRQSKAKIKAALSQNLVWTGHYVGPLVSSISPGAGPLRSGTVVTITGSGFTDATAVKFGAALATTFTVVSATTIMATAPSAAAAQMVAVTVTTPDGTSPTSVNNEYTYQAVPTLAKVSPAAGPAAGGTMVIITGTGFTNVASVLFDTTAATNVTVDSSTQITVMAPPGSGTVDITVITPGGTSALSSRDKYTYGM